MKSGKELTQLELLKRLNLMGIKYDSNIMGKNYYINLYDKEINSPINQEKIKNELEKDKIYIEYLNNNLRIRKESSIKYFVGKKNTQSNNNRNYFYDEYNKDICIGTLIYCNIINYINLDIKVLIIKLKECIGESNITNLLDIFLNCVDGINKDIFKFLNIMIFISIVIIVLISFIKSIKKKNELKGKRK